MHAAIFATLAACADRGDVVHLRVEPTTQQGTFRAQVVVIRGSVQAKTTAGYSSTGSGALQELNRILAHQQLVGG